jgi:hypothetical protein
MQPDMQSATRVVESRVFPHPAAQVWRHVGPADLKFWTSAVASSEPVKNGPLTVGTERQIRFKDGARERYRVVEISELQVRSVRLGKPRTPRCLYFFFDFRYFFFVNSSRSAASRTSSSRRTLRS